ncbi:MAG: type II toxin-antitoxin system RatA family toxin [Pseudomonadota bacterium]|nr:ubiquinone-binding protein [Alteromonas sp.]MDY6926618.1 type II toxin-antitoxin system RatA family toxin [Pseudomonadota bacterium]HCB16545.1 ubiquinone-binding protein [Alteromonas sp.]|tara:strand:+ start:562 stop:993 length:432 start_codon:yes stop_codon:yes gene_type:complete
MPKIQRSALVAYSAQSMFDLVNDVESYSEFLPGCSDSKIVSQQGNAMQAALLVSKAGIKQWFTTQNVLDPAQSISMTLVDGPFKQLSGGWTFSSLSESACKIELSLQFEFKNKMIELAFGKVFNSLAASMVNAFTQRAKLVYA